MNFCKIIAYIFYYKFIFYIIKGVKPIKKLTKIYTNRYIITIPINGFIEIECFIFYRSFMYMTFCIIVCKKRKWKC